MATVVQEFPSGWESCGAIGLTEFQQVGDHPRDFRGGVRRTVSVNLQYGAH